MSSGEFYKVGGDLRNLQRQLGDISRQIREHAKTTAATDVDRARLEGEMANQVQTIQNEVAALRKWASQHMKEHTMETGPQTPKLAIVTAAREDTERASAEEKRASAEEKRTRAALWSKIAIVVGAGGVGAVIRTLLN